MAIDKRFNQSFCFPSCDIIAYHMIFITGVRMLKNEVFSYLSDLPDVCHFFRKSKGSNKIIGSVNGKFIAIVVMNKTDELSKQELNFSERLYRSGAEHYVIRDLQDICEIAKVRRWW